MTVTICDDSQNLLPDDRQKFFLDDSQKLFPAESERAGRQAPGSRPRPPHRLFFAMTVKICL